MSSATTVCRFALAIVGLAACAAEAEGVRWDAPFGGSIAEPEDDAESDDTSPPAPVDSGDDPDGPPKPTSDSSEDPIDTDAGTWGDVEDTDASSSGFDPSDVDSSSTGDDTDDIPPADSDMDADPGTQPAVGPWSSCEGTTCQVGMGCLQGQVQGAVCTVACNGFDPASCPASPGDTVEPVCISVMGQGVCALDCSGGLVCPVGMTCVVDNDDGGQIEVCL